MTLVAHSDVSMSTGVRYLVDTGTAGEAHGLPFPVLLTYAAYGDAVRWERTDCDESEAARLDALLCAVASLRQHLYRHPNHRHVAVVRRLLNRAASGALAHGVLPTLAHLSVELGADEHDDPSIIVGLLS